MSKKHILDKLAVNTQQSQFYIVQPLSKTHYITTGIFISLLNKPWVWKCLQWMTHVLVLVTVLIFHNAT